MAYEPTVWKDGEVITAARMNKLEQSVKNEQVGPQGPAGAKGPAGERGPQGPAGPSYTLPAANKTTLGGVKQAALVAEATGESVTKAEFKALLDALKAAGIMASI